MNPFVIAGAFWTLGAVVLLGMSKRIDSRFPALSPPCMRS